jgi:hypothetical protein
MDITKKLPKNRVITMLQYKDHVTDDSLTRVSIYIDHVNPKHRMDTMSNWIEFDIKENRWFSSSRGRVTIMTLEARLIKLKLKYDKLAPA